jgi:hypothetical protein
MYKKLKRILIAITFPLWLPLGILWFIFSVLYDALMNDARGFDQAYHDMRDREDKRDED